MWSLHRSKLLLPASLTLSLLSQLYIQRALCGYRRNEEPSTLSVVARLSNESLINGFEHDLLFTELDQPHDLWAFSEGLVVKTPLLQAQG
jgi:hypothetical protein